MLICSKGRPGYSLAALLRLDVSTGVKALDCPRATPEWRLPAPITVIVEQVWESKMANAMMQQFMFSFNKMHTLIDGSISINSSAAVTATNMNGVASAARTGTGTYTITLNETYNAFLGAHFTVLAATAVDLVPQLVSVDVTSAKTIVVKLLTGATATDPAAAITLYPVILLRNSSVAK